MKLFHVVVRYTYGGEPRMFIRRIRAASAFSATGEAESLFRSEHVAECQIDRVTVKEVVE